jgi:hypothetical protein
MNDSNSTTLPANLVLDAVPRGNVDVSISREDVIAVFVVEAEQMIEQQLKAARDSAADCRRRSDEAMKIVNGACKSVAEQATGPTSEAFQTAFKVWGVGNSYVTTNTIGTLSFKDNAYDADADEAGEVPAKAACVRVQLVVTGPSGSVTLNKECKLPKAARQALAQSQKLQKEARQFDQDAVNWKRQQVEVPTLERKARACLASHQLRSTTQGAALLEHLLGQVGPTALKLPAPKGRK